MTCSQHLQIGLAVLFLSWPCSAHAVTLHVTDDIEIQIRSHTHSSNTQKDSKHPDRKYQHSSSDDGAVSVGRSRHGKASIGFVKFDVSLLPPDTQIERAVLRLWVSQLRQSGRLKLHEVLENWQEHGLRDRHLPPFGPAFHSLPLENSDNHKFVTVEVTTVVQGWLDRPATNFGLALVSEDADALHVEFDSKENPRTGHPMEIEVTLAPGIGPEGPQGQQGLKGDQGPQGPAGPAVQLRMLGQNCLPGNFLTGFDLEGNILCSALPTGGPSGVNDVNPGDVIITEIMANPAAVMNDTDGEWFEIFNTRADTVNIAGWSIQEEGGSHTISASTPLFIPSGEFLILGNNANITTNGGIPVDYQYAGIILNNNGGDTITLFDVKGEEIDSVDYGASSFPTPPAGKSFNLDSAHFNGNDNDDGSFWCPSTTSIGPGQDAGTPGTANELCSSGP